jgi:hypothetical protein
MRTREEKLRFLEEKLRLLRPFLEPQFGEMLQELMSQLRPKLNLVDDETLKSGDAELEKRIARYLSPDRAADLRATLIKQFGLCRLGEDADTIIHRILRRERIADDSEAAIAINHLGDQLDPRFGSEEYIKLGMIVAAYEKKSR